MYGICLCVLPLLIPCMICHGYRYHIQQQHTRCSRSPIKSTGAPLGIGEVVTVELPVMMGVAANGPRPPPLPPISRNRSHIRAAAGVVASLMSVASQSATAPVVAATTDAVAASPQLPQSRPQPQVCAREWGRGCVRYMRMRTSCKAHNVKLHNTWIAEYHISHAPSTQGSSHIYHVR